MTPDQVQVLSRAATQLAALAQPDVAAVVASLPRRPGATASLTELAEASGLELRTLGRAVARGRDAGVLRADGERIGLHPDGPRSAVAALVGLTPLGAALTEHAEHPERAEIGADAPYGLVHGVPDNDARVLDVVAGLLPTAEVTEAEVTAALSRLGDDPVGLRRALVDAGLLWRTTDGARYRRSDAR